MDELEGECIISESDSVETASGEFSYFILSGQVLGGVAGGALFFIPLYNINFLAGSLGYLVGSSVVVCIVGNLDKRYGSFWATLLGGTLGGIAFASSFISYKKFDGYELLIYSLLASIPFEILGYYLTKPASSLNRDYQSFELDKKLDLKSSCIKPVVEFPIININF